MRRMAWFKAMAWVGTAAAGMGTAAWGQIFVPYQIDLPAGYFNDAQWVDFNRDGSLDIALAYTRPGKSGGFRNPTLPDTFTTDLYAFNPAVNRFTLFKTWNLGGRRLAVNDIDYNGWPDIMVTGPYEAFWHMNLGTGTESLRYSKWLDRSYGFTDFRFADLNHSGYLDLVAIGMANSENAIVEFHPGDRPDWSLMDERGLTRMGAIAGRTALGVGDLDNDGFLDVVESGQLYVTSYSANTISTKVFRADSLAPRNVQYSQRAVLASVTSGSITLFDYDGDGDLDILVTGCNAGALDGWLTQLYRNDGNFVFVPLSNTGLDHFGRSAADFADLNGDGRKDLVISGTTASGIKTRIYLNQGAAANPIFSEVDPGTVPGVELGSVRLGDFNMDSKIDLLITGRLPDGKGTTRVYRNAMP